MAGDVDDACGFTKEGSRDSANFAALDGGDLDEFGAVRGEGDGGLRDEDAVGFGDRRGVHQVHLGFAMGAGKVASEHLAGDQFGVEFGNRTEIGHADRVALGGGYF